MDKYPEGFRCYTHEEHEDVTKSGLSGYPSSALLAQYGNRFNNLMEFPPSLSNGTGFHKLVCRRILSVAWALQRGVDTDMLDVLDI